MTDQLDDLGLIARYTRADAIADGILVDVSARARELGLRCPVALTQAVWAACVIVPPGVVAQDESGRLHDVLWMLAAGLRGLIAVRRIDERTILYGVRVRSGNQPGTPLLVTLKAIAGPDDDGDPCITVLMPNED